MITFEFDYYRPESIADALKIYGELVKMGKSVIYYAGGTEIIYLARLNEMRFDAVIDLKQIPECNQLSLENNELVIGAAVTLTKIVESNFYPLLGAVCRGIADHTARGQITLGGNICGKIPYKEAILPLLLAESQVILAGPEGLRTIKLAQVYQQAFQFKSGEFLMQIKTEHSFASLPHTHLRKTKQAKIGYPVLTVAALKGNNGVRVAFSGLCSFPFRSAEIEKDLNRGVMSEVLSNLPGPILEDQLGSARYREFVVQNALEEVMEILGGGQ